MSPTLPKMWPGFLAVWAAIALHLTWIGALTVPGNKAFYATPVHTVWGACGQSSLYTLLLISTVVIIAAIGTFRNVTAGQKIVYLMPQQLLLGISAAGAMLAMYHGHFADGVARDNTFIIADQMAVVLTWTFHTVALMFLWFIHLRVLTAGGWNIVHRENP